MKYTYLEVETINSDYEEQVPLKVIVENINREFHNGKPVRNVNSISYVVNKINNDDGWYERLEENWLKTIE